MTTDEKCDKITELLEEKNVTIQDDYFWDIFRNGDTNEEIFHVTNQRNLNQSESESVLDEVLSKLTSYESN